MVSQTGFIGDPLITYTDKSSLAPLGERVWNDVYKCWMVAVANFGASIISAGMCCVASTTDRNSGGVHLSGAGGGETQFAGIRPNGAADIAAAVGSVYQYGYIICGGPALQALAIAGATVTGPELPLTTGTTAGKLMYSAGSNASAATVFTALGLSYGIFGYSQAAEAAAKVDINIVKSVYN